MVRCKLKCNIFIPPISYQFYPSLSYRAKSCCLTSSTGLGHVSLDSGSPNVMYNQPNIHQGWFNKRFIVDFVFPILHLASLQALFPLLDAETRPAQVPQVKCFLIFKHFLNTSCFLFIFSHSLYSFQPPTQLPLLPLQAFLSTSLLAAR